jgi:hypothetical protein
MTDIEILKEIIQNTARVPLEEDIYGNGKRTVILTETNLPNSKTNPPNYSVTINGMPDDDQVIVIKSDNFVEPKAVFQGSKGECKRADFVIIANTDKKKVIFCIELKSGDPDNKEIIQQLKGAYCFTIYCREIGKIFWEEPDFLEDYEYRFISITKILQSKTPVFKDVNIIIDKISRPMLKISSSNVLYFRQLIAW